MRLISFYEWSYDPDCDQALAHLGTGPFDAVFSREIAMPRISFFFSHATNEYLKHFVSFGTTRFNNETKSFDATRYRDSLEAAGGPLWLCKFGDKVKESALACITGNASEANEDWWMATTHDLPLTHITSAQALSELAGEESQSHPFAIYIHIKGPVERLVAVLSSEGSAKDL